MVENIILKPNPLLLDANFNGYKLYCPENNICHSKELKEGLFKKYSRDTCYLYTHLHSLHNHLYCDPFDQNLNYVFNSKGHLQMIHVREKNFIEGPFVIWQADLDQSDTCSDMSGISANVLQHPPSIFFPSTTLAVTSNGCGTLNLLQTGDRSNVETWLSILDAKVAPGLIVDSVLLEIEEMDNSNPILHLLLLSVTTLGELKLDDLNQGVEEFSKGREDSISCHVLHWYTFTYNGSTWQYSQQRRIMGFGVVDFVSFDPTCEEVILLCHDKYTFIYDSLHPLQEPTKATVDQSSQVTKFLFSNDKDTIKLWFNLGANVEKKDVKIKITSKKIMILVKGDALFERTFLHAVASDTSTWTFDCGHLEIEVLKENEETPWRTVFDDGDKGGELIDATDEKAGARLAHLTSDKWNPNPEPKEQAFNPGQLESCDAASEDLFLMCLDGNKHYVNRLSQLGAVLHLFNGSLTFAEKDATGDRCNGRSFCLRHDVDGVLYRVTDKGTFSHHTTFDAFGFVKASKAMAKYTLSPADNSYVAVCDVNSHIYIFRQSRSFGGDLRNRKSGKSTSTLSRQLIVSLKKHEEVMGIYCTESSIRVLYQDEISIYELNFGE